MRYLMVDRILEVEPGKRAVGIKNIAMSEDFLTHHFPQYPVMPGVLIVEAMVQLGSWLIAATTDFKFKCLLHTINLAKFRQLVRPGDSLTIEIVLDSLEEDMAAFRGKGKLRSSDKVATMVDFKAKLIELEKLETPSVARETFDILCRG